jgi:hypothetical protein
VDFFLSGQLAHRLCQSQRGAFESPAILATLAHHLEATRKSVIDYGYPRGALAIVLIAVRPLLRLSYIY